MKCDSRRYTLRRTDDSIAISYCHGHCNAREEESDKEQLEIRPGERRVDSRFEVWLEEDICGSTRHE